MTIRFQCPRDECLSWARWRPVVLIHQSVDGERGSSPASVMVPLLLCDDHQREARSVDDVLDKAAREQLERAFAQARRKAPDWETAELSWTCEH